MNCKPGDLAIITRGRERAGRIVEVVSACPKDVQFRLPNGIPHAATQCDWVVRFQNPISVGYRYPQGKTVSLKTVWSVERDSALRPIRGLPIDEETHDEAPV